jgi:hypothetical protein
MRWLAIVLASALLCACSSLKTQGGVHAMSADSTAPKQSDCDSLDNSQRTWGAIAAGTGVAAGAGGVGTALPTDSTPRVVTGLSSLAVGVFSAVATFMANSYSSDYTKKCTDPKATQNAYNNRTTIHDAAHLRGDQ